MRKDHCPNVADASCEGSGEEHGDRGDNGGGEEERANCASGEAKAALKVVCRPRSGKGSASMSGLSHCCFVAASGDGLTV